MELKASACVTSSEKLQSCSSLSDAAHKLALIELSCVAVAPEIPLWTLRGKGGGSFHPKAALSPVCFLGTTMHDPAQLLLKTFYKFVY